MGKWREQAGPRRQAPVTVRGCGWLPRVFVPGLGEALVTVVVVTYNGAHRLDRCLDAVAAQDLVRAGQVACVVVDNGSRDGSSAVLAARTDGVRVIRSPRNLGFAGGNNVALRQVSSPYVVLVNDDAVVQPGWLSRLLEPFDDPRVGAVAGKLLLQPRFVSLPLRVQGVDGVGVRSVSRDGEPVTDALVWDPLLLGKQDRAVRWCKPEIELLIPLREDTPRLERPVRVQVHMQIDRDAVVRIAGREHSAAQGDALVEVELPSGTRTTDVINSAGTVLTVDAYAADRGFGCADDGGYEVAGEVFGGCGASLALRCAALRQVGMFDDVWFLYYEDVDLCWRLRRGGWIVRYQPRAVARHEHSASVGTGSELHVFHDARNRLLTLAKNASLPLVSRSVVSYVLANGVLAVKASAQAEAPPRRHVVLRLRVVVSFLRLLPGVVRRRRAVQRAASVSRRAVETWLGRELRGSQ